MDSEDGYLDEYLYYNGDDDDEEEEDDDDITIWNNNPYQGNYCGFRPSFLYSQNYTLPTPRYITPEEADRNARKLLEEEEREKEKADKKRLKKKRQKDRRRQQKLQEAQNGGTSLEEKTVAVRSGDGDGPAEVRADDGGAQHDSSTSVSDDDLDLGSTFVLQAQKKMNKPKPERRERSKEPSRERAAEPSKERASHGGPQRGDPQPPAAPQPPNNMNILDRSKIQKSLDLANIGNNMAGQRRFVEALHYYTEAIKLNPSEYRFLGNRAYVFGVLGRYSESLADAEISLTLHPNFLKGHFRKGKALMGLKRYSEAISAFQQVLIFDVNHVEAAAEILQCQQKLQEAMTSTRVKVLSTAPLSPPAAPPTFVPGQNNKVFVPRNIYSTASKAAAAGGVVGASSGVVHSKLYPIWVGNVTEKITEKILRQKFEPFGVIHSVRVLYSRTCAFINFTDKDCAEAAFRSLQGVSVEGTTFVLQLRNPDHHSSGVPGVRKTGK